MALFGLVASGCYQPTYSHTVNVFGEMNAARNERIADEAADLPWDADYSDIRILSGSAPEGVHIDEQGSKIVVEEAYASRYEVIGSLSTQNDGNQIVSYYFYEPPHDSEGGARMGWCVWQAPFRALTLGLWSIFVPFNYACFVDTDGDPLLLEGELRRGARAMGGNLVIVVGSIDRIFVHAGSGQQVGSSAGIGLNAYVLRDNGESAAPAPATQPAPAPEAPAPGPTEPAPAPEAPPPAPVSL